MLISLVSGTFNRLPLLTTMVQSFRDNLLPGIAYEIVLVDGGSTDGTIAWAKAQPDIRLIEDGKLTGAIDAFTRGAKAARGKYCLLANDDIAFFPHSVMAAIIHLENNITCGAVAMRDNRPILNGYTKDDYKTLQMPAVVKGRETGVIYAQVGLFRKWLGDRCNWWLGEHEEMKGARTYGGDNCLSAQIWAYGYSVDEVPECVVEDTVIEDELRRINREIGYETDDSSFYYKQWKTTTKGPTVPDKPLLPQLDKRAARILYLPIYEPGWAAQKDPVVGKRALRDALMRATNARGEPCIVSEVDYMAIPQTELKTRLLDIATRFKPDVILTQIQAAQPITDEMLAELKSRTRAIIVNWNGDQAVGGLKSGEIMRILRHVDLQTMVSRDVSDFYDKMGVKWEYWQIGYETVDNPEQALADYYQRIGTPNPFENYPDYPVVFLGSLRSPARQRLAEIVRSFGGEVFSPGDQWGTLYNFAAGQFIYSRAKIAISDNEFPDSYGFVSNRLMQAMSAGGCVVLQQHVNGLDELTGLHSTSYYVEYGDLDELKELVADILRPEMETRRKQIATAGTAFIREHHSFDARVQELFGFMRNRLANSGKLASSVSFKYIGRMQEPFSAGRGAATGIQYDYEVGHTLLVHKDDEAQFLSAPHLWERIEV